MAVHESVITAFDRGPVASANAEERTGVVEVGAEYGRKSGPQHFLRAPSRRYERSAGRYSVAHEKACGAGGRDLAGYRRGRGGPAGLFWLFAAELCGGGNGCRHGRGRTDELPGCQPQGQVPIAAALGLSLNWFPVLFANIDAAPVNEHQQVTVAHPAIPDGATRHGATRRSTSAMDQGTHQMTFGVNAPAPWMTGVQSRCVVSPFAGSQEPLCRQCFRSLPAMPALQSLRQGAESA